MLVIPSMKKAAVIFGGFSFIGWARPGYLPTEGCIALARRHLLIVLERLKPGSAVRILRSW